MKMDKSFASMFLLKEEDIKAGGTVDQYDGKDSVILFLKRCCFDEP